MMNLCCKLFIKDLNGGGLEELPATFKNRRSNEHFEAWRDKPLHGQFIRELDDGIDLPQQWSWLHNSNLKKETEGLVMAAGNLY